METCRKKLHGENSSRQTRIPTADFDPIHLVMLVHLPCSYLLSTENDASNEAPKLLAVPF